MLESVNIKLVPTDEEMIEVMATYPNEVIQRILKRIDYTPNKDEIVKGNHFKLSVRDSETQ